ncbi:MAG: DUF1192 domain-containing protein [Pseudomonadota bacterium]
MDPEDLEPRKAIQKPKDLESLGIDELKEYLSDLEAEVLQVKAKIEAKKAYLSSAGGLFKS